MDRDDQIKRFLDLGLVDDTFEKAAEIQPMGNPYDESLALETRARSWIHSNSQVVTGAKWAGLSR